MAKSPMTGDRITVYFFMALAVVIPAFYLSGAFLIFLGDSYILGSIVEKIHPATWLGFLFIAVQMTGSGRKKIIAIIKDSPGVAYLALGTLGLVTYVALFLDSQATGLPDTWLLTLVIFILCSELNLKERTWLGYAFDLFFFSNSMLGIVESVSNHHLIPIVVSAGITGQYTYPIEWRSGAFLGHPLSNAYLTGAYVLTLVLDQRIKAFAIRLPLLCLHGIALLAFASRAASGVVLTILALALLWQLLRSVMTGKVAVDLLYYLGTGVFLGGCGIPLILASGFADRFMNRFLVDHGSAAARTNLLEMLFDFPLADVIVGPSRVLVASIGLRYGIGAGVESFELNYLFLYGIIGCLIFFPTLILFCRDVGRKVGMHGYVVLIYFFICCATSVSLASKSLMFALLVGLLMTSRHMRVPVTRIPNPHRRRLAIDDIPFGPKPAAGQGSPGTVNANKPRHVGRPDRNGLCDVPSPHISNLPVAEG